MLTSALSSVTIPLLVLCLYAGRGCATSYKAVQLPDSLSIIYPGGQWTAGQNTSITADGFSPPSGAVAFAWNTSMSLLLPNGTTVDLATVFQPSYCHPAGVVARVSTPVTPGSGSYIGGELTNQTGQYTAIWNTTYGTTTSPPAANGSCSVADLSYQSWILKAHFTVLPRDQEAVFIPTLTKMSSQYTPAPTGSAWVASDARAITVSVTLLVGSAALVMLQML